MANLGQQQFGALCGKNQKRRMCFQAAEVRKPLLAVSGACDRDQFVIFDNAGSWIARRNTVIGQRILALMQEMSEEDKLQLTRKNGTYSMPVWVLPPASETGFQRQGR